jgi:IS5 family transposase
MLRDRYPAVDLFALVPALTLAFEPVLARLDQLLDDDALFQAVKADLAQRRPRTLETGRPSTPVEVILRMLIVRRLYGWSYAETERFVGDSLVLRQFCRLGLERAPDDTTLLRWANLLQPTTLDTLLDHVVALARQLQVTRGRKLRVDSTVVGTAIRHPTDSGLLADAVRMLGRVIRRAQPLAGAALASVREAFRTRTRSARRQLQRIHRLARRPGDAAEADRQAAYARLCRIARTVARQAERARAALVPESVDHPERDPAADRLVGELDRLVPLTRRVVDQAERRVLRGEQVAAIEKVASLVEPHTAIIPRHKAGQSVEFGRKLWLAEVDGGIISDVDVLDGAPPDAPRVIPSVERHRRQFGRPPDLLTGDRGCSTAAVRRDAAQAGVRRVALPQAGPPTTASRARERERWFRRGYRWRSGIEGRIGVLRRVYGLDRCPDHGSDGIKRWVGLGVLTANLVTIARATAA